MGWLSTIAEGAVSLFKQGEALVTGVREAHQTEEVAVVAGSKISKGANAALHTHGSTLEMIAEGAKGAAGLSEKATLVANVIPGLGQVAEVVEHVGAAGVYGAAALAETGNEALHLRFRSALAKFFGGIAGAATTAIPYVEGGDVAAAGGSFIQHERQHTAMNGDTLAQRLDKKVQSWISGGETVETVSGSPSTPPMPQLQPAKA